jgi:hypothetical protein
MYLMRYDSVNITQITGIVALPLSSSLTFKFWYVHIQKVESRIPVNSGH